MTTSDEVRTRKLIIVDNDNRERVSIDGSWSDGTCTIMLMGKRAGGLFISIDEVDRLQISVRSSSNSDAAIVSVDDQGEPWIRLNDKNGVPVLLVGRTEDGTFKIMVIDKERVAWSAPHSP